METTVPHCSLAGRNAYFWGDLWVLDQGAHVQRVESPGDTKEPNDVSYRTQATSIDTSGRKKCREMGMILREKPHSQTVM